MNRLPLTPEIATLARRLIWFEEPDEAIADQSRFMAYAFARATAEDIVLLRRFLSEDDFREALDTAPPGIIPPRDWAYWNLVLGRYPAPPMPTRLL